MNTPGGTDVAGVGSDATRAGVDAPPDWGTFQGELHCPRCGYNLRMLAEPRCPECGLRSTWGELTDRTVHEQATGLFEYCWRRRPVRSCISTLWRCMFPWLLWPRLPLVTEPRRRPLLFLALLVVAVEIARCAVLGAIYDELLFRLVRRTPPSFGWSLFREAVRGLDPLTLIVITGVLTLLGMLVFRQTMSRYRVRRLHVERIALMSWLGFMLWMMVFGTLATVATMVEWLCFSRFGIRLDVLEGVAEIRDVIPILCYVLSISLAWSTYLKVERGWAIGPLVLTLTATAAFVAVFLYTFDARRSLDNDLLRMCKELWPTTTAFFSYVCLQFVR